MMDSALKPLGWISLCFVFLTAIPSNVFCAETEMPAKKKADVDKPVETQQPSEAKTAVDPQASRRTSLIWRATVKVVNPDDVRAQIDKEVRLLGGFPMFFNGNSISVKLPPAALPALAEKIGEVGLVLEKTLNREDLTLRIAELTGMLKSKREILGRTRKFLDDSDVPATLEIERAMTGLVMEIEQLQGSLRVLKDRVAFAVVDISFEFRERDKIVYVQSPFEWLNTVDLGQFSEEF
jgi:hypothetical protein